MLWCPDSPGVARGYGESDPLGRGCTARNDIWSATKRNDQIRPVGSEPDGKTNPGLEGRHHRSPRHRRGKMYNTKMSPERGLYIDEARSGACGGAAFEIRKGTNMTDFDSNRYADLLALVKGRVRQARVRAGLAANAELIMAYWDIGTTILQRQAEEGWGAEVIQRLSRDLRMEFPEMQGFSERNLKYMRKLAEVYPDREKVQQLVAQIPWGHTLHLLHKVKNEPARDWYIRQTVEHGWSRNVLALHVDAQDYERKGQAVTNFSRTLPSSQSDLARDILKNPYLFDFLGLADDMRERELECALLGHLREFLLELGNGFAFVGNQVRLVVGDEDYYIDLLFYHLKLRCYVVIDLKTRPFLPEDAGKMNFYLNAVDDQLRHPDDRQSIGLVLCREKEENRLVLEYALRGLAKPIGVSEYALTRALPRELETTLPTIDEIERELAEAVSHDDQAETDGEVAGFVRELAGEYRLANRSECP